MSVTTISASLDSSNEFVCSGEGSFSGEHNAQLLEITLNEELASSAYDYITIAFDVGIPGSAGASDEIVDGEDSPVYRIDNKIYCPLTEELTSTGRLKLQLSAYTVDGQDVKNIRKSGILEIGFKPSIRSSDEIISGNTRLLGQIYAAIAQLRALGVTVGTLESSLTGLSLEQQEQADLAEQTAAAVSAVEQSIAQVQASVQELDGVQPIAAGSFLSLENGVMSADAVDILNSSDSQLPTCGAVKNYADQKFRIEMAHQYVGLIAATVATLKKGMDSHCVALYANTGNMAVNAAVMDSAVVNIADTDNYFFIVPFTDSGAMTLFDVSYNYQAGKIYKITFDTATELEVITPIAPEDYPALLGLTA